MKLFATIAKRDDSQRMVWGYASTEALDCQGEIITHAAMSAALDGYMKFANIREMHQPSAVGVAKEAEMDEKGLFIGVKVVDAGAWEKVKEGVYKGFSIGGNVLERDAADENIITGLELVEISLVDRPANPEALIEVWKFHQGEENMSKAAKKAVSAKTKKGFYEVARMADLCSALQSLALSVDYEAEYEGDASAMPAKIKSIASQLCSALVELATEESAEAVAQMGIASDEMKSAAEKLGKSAEEDKEDEDDADKSAEGEEDDADKSEDEEDAQKSAEAEEDEDAEKSEEDDDAEKSAEEDDEAEKEDDEEDDEAEAKEEEQKRAKAAHAKLLKSAEAQNAMLAKSQKLIKEMAASMEKMSKRVKELEAMDAPRKGALKEVPGAVSKAQDVAGAAAKAAEPEDFLSALKKVHATGGKRYM